MENKELEKRIIAVMLFDGWEFVHDDPESYPDGYYYDEKYGTLTIDTSEYHLDYNWLMGLWVKFRDLKFPQDSHEDWLNGTGVGYQHTQQCAKIEVAILINLYQKPSSPYQTLSSGIKL